MKPCIVRTVLILIIVLFGAVISHNLKHRKKDGVHNRVSISGINKASQIWHSIQRNTSSGESIF